MSSGSDTYWKNKKAIRNDLSSREGNIYKIKEGRHAGSIACLLKVDGEHFLYLLPYSLNTRLEVTDEYQLLRVASYMAKDIYEYSK